MPTPVAAPAPLPGDVSSEALLRTLLAIAPVGVMLLRPVYAQADPAAIIDFSWAQLNPAAQQQLGLPECPTASFLTLFPTAQQVGPFTFYRDAFLSGEVERRQQLYQADGLDGYYQLVAQRQGPLLVVSFSDTNEQPRSVVEKALRQSQEAEWAAQAEAKRERAQLHALLTQAPVAIALFTGQDLRVASANAQMAAMWGYTPAQVVGRPLLEGVPELQGQGFDDLLRQVLRTRVPVSGTEAPALMRRNGELLTSYYNFVYQPLYDTEGHVLGIIDVAVDVTEQVLARRQVEQLNAELETRVQARAQEALSLQAELLATAQHQAREREAYYTLFAQVPAGICLLAGPDLVYEFANPAYQRLLPGRELLGLPILVALPELTGTAIETLMRQVYATGETSQVQEQCIPVRRPGGNGELEDRYFTFIYQARRDEAHRITGILNFVIEVTTQVRARQERETQQRLMHTVFEQAPVAIAIFRGPQYVIELANSSVCALWGRTPVQAVGTPLFELLPEAAGQGFEELLDQVRLTGEPFIARELPSFINREGRRDTVYWNFVYAPIVEADGTIERITVVATEGTEQVRARQQVQALNEELAAMNEEITVTNEELNQSNQQLTRTNEDLDTFVYTASHDLKAPITNIEGLLEALRYELPADVQQQETTQQLLSMMQGAIERFRNTIDQLTDVSRLQEAQNQPAEQVQVARVVEDVRLDLLPLLTSTKAQFLVEVGLEVHVLFSPKNLRAVVVNLVSNALKYHQHGQPPVVLLRAVQVEGRVVLTVTDNGLGMSAQQQTRLFGLFQRLHTHVEGSGVGLYMVKRILDNAGGTIAVTSEPGKGTMFRVTFPADKTR